MGAGRRSPAELEGMLPYILASLLGDTRLSVTLWHLSPGVPGLAWLPVKSPFTLPSSELEIRLRCDLTRDPHEQTPRPSLAGTSRG